MSEKVEWSYVMELFSWESKPCNTREGPNVACWHFQSCVFFTRSGQQHPSMDVGRVHEPLSLTEEPLTDFWVRESQFSLRLCGRLGTLRWVVARTVQIELSGLFFK